MDKSTSENSKKPSPPAAIRAMDAAVVCFSEMGIHKTNMEDVAKRAGMARSTLYRYFKDRDELILAVVEREAEKLAQEVVQRISRYSNIRAYIVEGILYAYDATYENPLLARLFEEESTSIANRLLLATNKLQFIAVEALKQLIQPAQESGMLRKDVSLELMMDWLLRILLSFIAIPSEFTRTEEARREMLDQMLLPVLIEGG